MQAIKEKEVDTNRLLENASRHRKFIVKGSEIKKKRRNPSKREEHSPKRNLGLHSLQLTEVKAPGGISYIFDLIQKINKNQFLKKSNTPQDLEKIAICLNEALSLHPDHEDKTDWNKKQTIYDIIEWQSIKLKELNKFDALYLTSDDSEFNLLGTFEYKHPQGYFHIPVDNIHLIKDKNPDLYIIMVQALRALNHCISIPSWEEEYGEYISEMMHDQCYEQSDELDDEYVKDIKRYIDGDISFFLGEITEGTFELNLKKFEKYPEIHPWAAKLSDLMDRKISLHKYDFYAPEFMLDNNGERPISYREAYSLVYNENDFYAYDFAAMMDETFGSSYSLGPIYSCFVNKKGWTIPNYQEEVDELYNFLQDTYSLFVNNKIWNLE